MTSLKPSSKKWQDSFPDKLPLRLRSLFQANARSHLLKQVNTVLMVHDDRLHDLTNGSWRQIAAIATDSDRAQVLAAAAAELLNGQTAGRAVLLLLPSSDFIGTAVNMPGIPRENLRSALQLQAAVLLPGHGESLAFAVNTTARHPTADDIVLWMNEQWLDELFAAFADKGLFLAAVMARALAAATPEQMQAGIVVDDSDATTLTRLVFRNEILCQWLQIDRADLEDEIFLRQWQDATAQTPDGTSTRVSLESSADWLERHEPVVGDREYSFFPRGAQAARKQVEKGKRVLLSAVAVGVVLLIGSLPFLYQSLQAAGLRAALDEQRELAVAARADQALVREFEQRWGVLNEFPPQDIAAILLQLQNILSPSVLTSLEIIEGSLQIEGESDDPQSLLERLEQDPLFTGVDFARATNNNRYTIDLRLSTVDFDGYRQRYFPDVRR